MVRLPQPGGDKNSWGNILNEFLLQSLNDDGTLRGSALAGAGAYPKPTTGIPRSDLAADIQTSLDNADAAANGIAPDATATGKGMIRLAGDLTGTALLPKVAPGSITGGGGGNIVSGTITDENIHVSANIAKSKLAPLSITNSDVSSSANITQNKIVNLTTDLAGKASTVHTHNISDVTNLQTQLAAKADTAATQASLDAKANSSDLAMKANTSDVTTALSGKANTSHTHAITDVTNLQSTLSGKASTSHTHTASDITNLSQTLSDTLANKLVAGTNVSLNYDAGTGETTISAAASSGGNSSETVTTVAGRTGDVVLVAGDITAGTLATARIPSLDATKLTSGTLAIGRIPTGTTSTTVALGMHTHSVSDVTNLQTTLDAKAGTSDLSSGLATKANTVHTHAATDITSGTFATSTIPSLDATKVTSGTFDISRIPTGMSGTTVALGNHTHNSTYAAIGHIHDDRYYTETEIDTALASKLDTSQKGIANGIATLGSDNKIPSSQLPAIAINETFTAASQAAMLALTAQRGDMCIRTDSAKTYVLTSESPDTLADWKELIASGQVTSVNGKTGTVTLAKSDIGLANIDNTSDLTKPISTATQAALDAKIGTGALDSSTAALVQNTSSATSTALTATYARVSNGKVIGPDGQIIAGVNGAQGAPGQDAGMTFVRIGPNDPLPAPSGIPLIIFRDSA